MTEAAQEQKSNTRTTLQLSRRELLDKRERVEPPPRPQIPFVIWLMLAFILGAALMYIRMSSLMLINETTQIGRQSIEVRARADPREGDFGDSGEVLVLDGDFKGQRIELRYGRDVLPLELGQQARVTGLLAPLQLNEKQEYRLQRGIVLTMNVQQIENSRYAPTVAGMLWRQRAKLLDALLRISGDKEAKGLIAGITFGDRRMLQDTPLEGAFERTGLAHFLSVSGSHLVLFGTLLMFVLRKTALTRGWVSAITLTVCIGYVFFTGFAPGSIRSCGMLAVGLGAYLLRRRVCVMNSLGLVSLFFLVLDPLMAVSLAFLLSVCSVAGIVLFARFAQQWFVCLFQACGVPTRKRIRSIANGLAVSVVACTVTLPLTVDAFGAVPLASPVANLLIGPAIGALLGASVVSVLLFLLLPSLGVVCLRLCVYAATLIAEAAKVMARVPWASVPTEGFSAIVLIVFILCIVGLWLWWPRPTRARARIAALALASCLFLVACAPTQLFPVSGLAGRKEVVVLDVGQGDALLIRDGDTTVLMDAGPSEQRLREQLNAHGVRRIDLLFLTHDHADHVRGAQALDASYGIQQIMVAEGSQQTSTKYQNIAQRVNAPLVGMLSGEVVRLNNLEVRVIGPTEAVTDPGANASSLVTFIVDTTPNGEDRVSDDIVLTSGDAEATDVNKALDSPAADAALADISAINGGPASVDVLKVPHHGSKKSLDERLLSRIKARMAVFSVGADNSYGHPRPEPRALLEKFGLKIYRTDLDGAVVIPL